MRLLPCGLSASRPPIPLPVEEEERKEAERLADAMIQHRFGQQDWSRGDEQVGVAREVPSLEELMALPSTPSRL